MGEAFRHQAVAANLASGSIRARGAAAPGEGNAGVPPTGLRPTITYLPHEVVVLADIHTLWGDDSAGEGAHLRACLDPRLGEDAEALTGDGTLACVLY